MSGKNVEVGEQTDFKHACLGVYVVFALLQALWKTMNRPTASVKHSWPGSMKGRQRWALQCSG